MPEPDDLLEPADHSGDPAAPRSADDLTHLRDESYREVGQTLAGRWVLGKWAAALNVRDRDEDGEEE